MPISPKEAIQLAIEAEQLAELLIKCFKRDEAGKVRITKEEAKALSSRLLKFAGHIAKDALF